MENKDSGAARQMHTVYNDAVTDWSYSSIKED